jgi:hypothetical protein
MGKAAMHKKSKTPSTSGTYRDLIGRINQKVARYLSL